MGIVIYERCSTVFLMSRVKIINIISGYQSMYLRKKIFSLLFLLPVDSLVSLFKVTGDRQSRINLSVEI